MEHDNSPTTDHDTTHQGHGNDQAGQQHDAQRGITVPRTVLVLELDDRALVVQGQPEEPRAPRPASAKKRARQRAAGMNAAIVTGEVVVDSAVIVPIPTVEPAGKRGPG